MDRHQCSLCGGLFHPKDGHLCYLKEGFDNVDATCFMDELEKIANDLERYRNIPGDGISNMSAKRGETDLNCWLENEQKNTSPHPDQTSRSLIPAQFSRAFEVSSPYSFDDSWQILFDSPIQKLSNPSKAEFKTPQFANSMPKDNQSHDFEYSFSTTADCSTKSSEEHFSVVAPVPWPSAVETHSLRTQKAEKFLCKICGRGFIKRNQLNQHYRIHSAEKHFVCEKCSKKCRSKSDLVRHRRTHTGEKPFECPTCSKKFSESSNLQRHLKTHTSEKPFECSECNKKFSQKHHLEDHVRTHTGEKPFQCPECGNRFMQKHHLKAHLRTHTGEKPFQCPECGNRFMLKHHLKAHLRTHAIRDERLRM